MLGVPRDGELRDDDVRAVAQYVMDRADSATSAERLVLVLAPHREQIAKWLEGDTPLKLTKVFDLLTRRGVEVTCPTLRRFVIAELGWHNIGGRFDFG